MPAVLMQSNCVVDTAGRAANLNLNLSRGLPWVTNQPERTGSLAIVGSGPSVARRLDTLRRWSGDIWAINGAYDYLLGHGIVPKGFFCVDPLPGLAEYVANAQRETTFYVAATCDPTVLEALDGFKVELWFPNQQDKIYPERATEITGGTSAITRAPFLAHTLGWRDMTIFGADSSFEETGRYCYHDGTFQEDSKSQFLVIEVEGQRFLSDTNLMYQVSQFGVVAEQLKGCVNFDCDGLLSAYLRSPMHKIDGGGRVVLDIEEGRFVVDNILDPKGRPDRMAG